MYAFCPIHESVEFASPPEMLFYVMSTGKLHGTYGPLLIWMTIPQTTAAKAGVAARAEPET